MRTPRAPRIAAHFGEDGFHSDGDATRRRVIAVKPLSICFDGDRVEVQNPAYRVLCAARFVETEMPVLSKTQHDDVEALSAAVLAAMLPRVNLDSDVDDRGHSRCRSTADAPVARLPSDSYRTNAKIK